MTCLYVFDINQYEQCLLSYGNGYKIWTFDNIISSIQKLCWIADLIVCKKSNRKNTWK